MVTDGRDSDVLETPTHRSPAKTPPPNSYFRLGDSDNLRYLLCWTKYTSTTEGQY